MQHSTHAHCNIVTYSGRLALTFYLSYKRHSTHFWHKSSSFQEEALNIHNCINWTADFLACLVFAFIIISKLVNEQWSRSCGDVLSSWPMICSNHMHCSRSITVHWSLIGGYQGDLFEHWVSTWSVTQPITLSREDIWNTHSKYQTKIRMHSSCELYLVCLVHRWKTTTAGEVIWHSDAAILGAFWTATVYKEHTTSNMTLCAVCCVQLLIMKGWWMQSQHGESDGRDSPTLRRLMEII